MIASQPIAPVRLLWHMARHQNTEQMQPRTKTLLSHSITLTSGAVKKVKQLSPFFCSFSAFLDPCGHDKRGASPSLNVAPLFLTSDK